MEDIIFAPFVPRSQIPFFRTNNEYFILALIELLFLSIVNHLLFSLENIGIILPQL